MQVLILEQEVVVANAMVNALECRGHEVSVAANAEAALSLPRPEVLIADLELDGLSGLDLLEQYRRTGSAPRTVFVTANFSLNSCRKALRFGVSDVLPKPFRLEDLVAAVESGQAPAQALFEKTYPSKPSSIERAARELAAFAMCQGVSPTCRARACTAFGELLENCVTHAYPKSVGDIRVTATVDERDLTVTVSDDGVGLDSRQSAAEYMNSPLHDGLARAASLVEGIEIHSEFGVGTTITLRFGAYRADFDGEELIDLSEHDFLAPSTSREVLRTLQIEGAERFFQLSPALAVVVGRLLAGPDPRRVLAQALRS